MGPLNGYTVIELSGIGPAPMAGMILAEVMKTKTRGEWCEIMEGTDVCFAPVLTFMEAPEHPANGGLPSEGIPYVVVNGTIVVKDSKVLKGVFPGKPIRLPGQQ